MVDRGPWPTDWPEIGAAGRVLIGNGGVSMVVWDVNQKQFTLFNKRLAYASIVTSEDHLKEKDVL